MGETTMKGLCGSQSVYWYFWSLDVTWNTDMPDFTFCFQNTVLQWIPVVFFWLVLVFYWPYLRRQQTVIFGRTSAFNITKMILILVVLFVNFMDFLKSISEVVSGVDPPAVLFLTPVLNIVTLLMAVFITLIEYKKGIHTSGFLFFYWALNFVVGVIIFRSKIIHISPGDPNYDEYRTATSIISFLCTLTLFICHCFADPGVFLQGDVVDEETEHQPLLKLRSSPIPETSSRQQLRKPCPEMRSSFLARTTYYWLTGLMIRGYRRALTSADLWDLRPSDCSRSIVPKMEEQWQRELQLLKSSKRGDDANGTIDSVLQNGGGGRTYQRFHDGEPDTRTSDGGTRAAGSGQQNKKKKQNRPSFLRAIRRVFGREYLISGIFKFIYDLITFIQPQLLNALIVFIESHDLFVWRGYIYAVGLFLVASMRTVLFQQYWHGCYIVGMRLRTSIIGIVYRKSLKLSGVSRKESTVGEIVNLMSVDAQRLQDVPAFLHMIWSSPLTIMIAMYFLWQELGPSVLAGLIFMILLIPINAFLASKIKKMQMTQMRWKDQRIKLMSEILSGIKVLKLYAWEPSFQSKVDDIRSKELQVLRSAAYLNAVSSISWFCSPFLVALCTFTVYVTSSPDNVLTPQKAFVSLSLINILSFPMSMLPGTIAYMVQALVSISRLNKYLTGDELDLNAVTVNPIADAPINIENGTFSWGPDDPSILKNVNLKIRDGELVAVVGTVGTGKTSLISAILGEMHKQKGRVVIKEGLAYVPQQAWCQNSSLQENITFGKPLNQKLYERVVDACALKTDIQILPGGDQTEVGEKGINLSGGQKQRISLARAVYQDADIYLLDDPLSAVDSHVGKHIFNEVIGGKGLLCKKTRILVTHGLTYLPKMDRIVVIKDGGISEMGTYEELLSHNGPFAEFIRTYLDQDEEDTKEEGAEESDPEDRELKQVLRRTISTLSESELSGAAEDVTVIKSSGGSGGSDRDAETGVRKRQTRRRLSRQRSSISGHLRSKSLVETEALEKAMQDKKKRLIAEEIAEVGSVKIGVFISYVKAASYLMTFAVISTYLFYMGCSVGTNIWLSYWSESANETVNNTQMRDMYLGVYGTLGFGQAVFILLENFAIAQGTFLASLVMHKILLKNIMRAPNSFFDTTPLGRIVNRFAKDIDTVDINIPLTLRIWLTTFAMVLGAVIVISIASPVFLIALVPLGLLYHFAQRFYICTSRQLKRIDSIKRSPIYSHFQESIMGATSIRAYRKQRTFTDKSDILVDENQMAWYPNIVSYRWLGITLESIGNLIILLAGVLAVLARDTIGPGLAGLSVSYALQVTGSLNFMVRMTCDLESYVVAIERIQEYAELPTEAMWNIPDHTPPINWPPSGRVEFRNYSVRYRAGLDLVLRGIDAIVEPGQKVGIVGRTGAGKSSLTLALFRIIEPASGTILIDGIDICQIGLHDLRNKITIIPQDPVLFSGTLRMNLDPFDSYTDGQVWLALEHAHLKQFVTEVANGLNYACSEGGDNLSVGQRQLVCLARALLRKTRILILDEATAAVDLETDELIQQTIRREFRDATVLTIAHRLNTIMDYDRVMVLDQGRVIEFDSPTNLLRNTRSTFFSMASDAGLV